MSLLQSQSRSRLSRLGRLCSVHSSTIFPLAPCAGVRRFSHPSGASISRTSNNRWYSKSFTLAAGAASLSAFGLYLSLQNKDQNYCDRFLSLVPLQSVYCLSDDDASSDRSDDNNAGKDFVTWFHVKKQLSDIAEKCFVDITFSGDKENEQGRTITLYLPSNFDSFELFSGILSVLGDSKSDIDPQRRAKIECTDRSSSVQLKAFFSSGSELSITKSRLGVDRSKLEFYKTNQEEFTQTEVDTLSSALYMASSKTRSSSAELNAHPRSSKSQKHKGQNGKLTDSELYKALDRLGVRILENVQADWSELAGYQSVKRIIEDTVVLPLRHQTIYDSVSAACRPESSKGQNKGNRPRAILFEGHPGCGKSSAARILASQAKVPFVFVPIETLSSKWFGESEKRISELLHLLEQLPSAVLFVDEIDALAGSREDSNLHEASRRMLSVLLQHLDGIDSSLTGHGSILVAATNRKQDLDSALVSRFDVIVPFELPDLETRAEMFAMYAAHLKNSEQMQLAELCPNGFSGRDIKDVCRAAERDWASRIIRGSVSSQSFEVPYELYREALQNRIHSHSTENSLNFSATTPYT